MKLFAKLITAFPSYFSSCSYDWNFPKALLNPRILNWLRCPGHVSLSILNFSDANHSKFFWASVKLLIPSHWSNAVGSYQISSAIFTFCSWIHSVLSKWIPQSCWWYKFRFLSSYLPTIYHDHNLLLFTQILTLLKCSTDIGFLKFVIISLIKALTRWL